MSDIGALQGNRAKRTECSQLYDDMQTGSDRVRRHPADALDPPHTHGLA